jgi:hypothetical protein
MKKPAGLKKPTFEECQESRQMINKKLDHYGAILDSFPKLKNGLIPDIHKNTDEYKEARKYFDFWFSQLRQLNQYITKNHKKENYDFHMKNRLKKMKSK